MNQLTHRPSTTEHIANLCKALGDGMRVDILRVLAANSYGVLELADIFEVTQPRMSHHLKVLASAQLVTTRREGNTIFYRRPQLSTEDELVEFKLSAYINIDNCAIDANILSGLERVHQARANISQQFFIENASKFRAQQDLIASYPIYAQAITELLENSPLPAAQAVLELGPGEGEFLPVLSSHFDQVTGIDNSATMLHKAEQLCQSKGLTNVNLIEGDTRHCQTMHGYDCAVANMVLHHTPSPLTIFKDLYPTLKAGGVLLITELCLHDQNWAKEACGDVWLGFDPNDLNSWAKDTGFKTGQSTFLALKNGFQIQLKQFIKH